MGVPVFEPLSAKNVEARSSLEHHPLRGAQSEREKCQNSLGQNPVLCGNEERSELCSIIVSPCITSITFCCHQTRIKTQTYLDVYGLVHLSIVISETSGIVTYGCAT